MYRGLLFFYTFMSIYFKNILTRCQNTYILNMLTACQQKEKDEDLCYEKSYRRTDCPEKGRNRRCL